MSVTKKKRVSKKNKAAWRKHANVEDVEEFLEDQRVEERLGLTKKSNDELFQFDYGEGPSKPIELVPKTKKEARELVRNKIPKCFATLQPLTSVPDPVAKRNRHRSKDEKKSIFVVEKETKNRELGMLSTRSLQSFNDKKAYEEKLATKPKQKAFNVDMWNCKENHQVSRLEWVDDKVKTHLLKTMGQQRQRVPKLVQSKLTKITSIALPHPGTSYNPTLQDHSDLLKKVEDKERAIIKQEEHLNRVTRKMFNMMSQKAKDENYRREMSEGVNEVAIKSDDENTETENANAPVQNKKKTLKQRRKQREHRMELATLNAAKKEKRKTVDLHRLRELSKKVDLEEMRREEIEKKKQAKAKSKQDNLKKLGPGKFEEPEIDFNMPDAIAGNLRNLHKEGNLLLDRFKSLQRRNILQPTVRRNLRKAKTKRFQKPDHKDNNWKISVAGFLSK